MFESAGNSEYSLRGHSLGIGYVVCLNELSGSYSNETPHVGFHLACSLANPLRAKPFNFNC